MSPTKPVSYAGPNPLPLPPPNPTPNPKPKTDPPPNPSPVAKMCSSRPALAAPSLTSTNSAAQPLSITPPTNRKGINSEAPARNTPKHVLSCLSVALADLVDKDVLPANVADGIKLPKSTCRAKERAVLSDFELARYLAWEHPEERYQIGVLERKAMSCMARLFGGLRTGDLHAVRWEHPDAANGRFDWGYAPRAKTKSPQRLVVDEMLRPILRGWWRVQACPLKGCVFPVPRDGRYSAANEGCKHGLSHAKALRQDLRRAFGVDVPKAEKRKCGQKTLTIHTWEQVRAKTPRERVLFEETELTLPVDFHSWRRAYCQALADGGVNAQQAKALAGP